MRTLVVTSALAAFVIGAPAMARGKMVVKVSGSLNLTTANAEQLSELPGIGPKAAKAILDYRSKTHFTRVEDLVKVKGFGKKRFDRLRPYLALTGPTTIKVERTRPSPSKALGRAPMN